MPTPSLNPHACLGLLDWRLLNVTFRSHSVTDDDGTLIASGILHRGSFGWCYITQTSRDPYTPNL